MGVENKKSMPKAIIIGASSGIGEELARQLSYKGYVLGLAARREELLKELQSGLPTESFVQKMDVSKVQDTQGQFKQLVEKMGGVGLVIINAGIGFQNPALDPLEELDTIKTNVSGFTLIADLAFAHFMEQKACGHIVGISSIAALRGHDAAPAYNASKAFVSSYMQALRKKSVKEKLGITVTDIKPGFVDTVMAKGDDVFWVEPVPKACGEIIAAIEKKKPHAYITRRWRLIAWALKIMPDFIYNRI